MQQEDTPPSRQAPRFVPTLTEIVTPPSGVGGGAAAADAPSPSEPVPELEPEAISAESVESVESLELLELHGLLASPAPERADDLMNELLTRLGPELDVKLSETIAQVMQEQMPVLNARIRQAVTEVVREAVAGVLAQGGPPGPGENP